MKRWPHRRPQIALGPLSALLLCLSAAGCGGGDVGVADGGSCVVRDVAVLPVLNQVGSPIVKVAVNGRPVAFVIDTGAAVSIIGPDDAAALDLPISFETHHIITGIGGSAFAPDATIRELSLGTATARNISFPAIGAYRGQVGGLKVVGLFGGDFLANYDIEIDLPAHRVGLYAEQEHCGRHIVPWNGPFYEQPFDLERQTEVDFPILVDGRRTDVQLDSGATRTVLTSDDGAAAGATEAAMANDPRRMVMGVDGNPVVGHMHRFNDVAIGPEHLSPAFFLVTNSPRSLLGADFLRGHRVWISYRHEMLYIQPVTMARASGRTGG